MSGISDEMLMAYADGELGPGDRADVEAYLRSSPEAAKRLEVFDRTGRDLGALFDTIMRAPVPRHLIDAVDGPEMAGNIIDFQARARRRSTGATALGSNAKYALAASIAAVAVIAGAFALSTMRGSGDDGLLRVAAGTGEEWSAAPALARVLEREASGAASDVRSGHRAVTIKPVFTFATDGSGYCRQYVLESEAAGALGGVACRDDGGRWTVKAQVALKGHRAQEGGKIVPAGRDGAPEIEALVDRLIAGDVFGLEDEKRVIDGGWTKPSP